MTVKNLQKEKVQVQEKLGWASDRLYDAIQLLEAEGLLQHAVAEHGVDVGRVVLDEKSDALKRVANKLLWNGLELVEDAKKSLKSLRNVEPQSKPPAIEIVKERVN